jgi:hypothetical protein
MLMKKQVSIPKIEIMASLSWQAVCPSDQKCEAEAKNLSDSYASKYLPENWGTMPISQKDMAEILRFASDDQSSNAYLSRLLPAMKATFQTANPVFIENGTGFEIGTLKIAVESGFKVVSIEPNPDARNAIFQALKREGLENDVSVLPVEKMLRDKIRGDVVMWNTVPLPLYPQSHTGSFLGHWHHMSRHLQKPRPDPHGFLLTVLDASARSDLMDYDSVVDRKVLLGSPDAYNFAPYSHESKDWKLLDRTTTDGPLIPSEWQRRQFVDVYMYRSPPPKTTQIITKALTGLRFLRR